MQDGIALADVLAADLVEIVQRGVGDGDAGELDRLEFGDRGQRSDAADLHFDFVNDGLGLLGFELVGDGPSRRSRDLAQLFLQGKRIDLGDDAVGLVVEFMAAIGQIIPILEHRFDAGAALGERIHLETERLDTLKEIPLAIELDTLQRTGGMAKYIERARRRDMRIELAQRSSGGVARIRERRLAVADTVGVEAFETPCAERSLRRGLRADAASEVRRLNQRAAGCS